MVCFVDRFDVALLVDRLRPDRLAPRRHDVEGQHLDRSLGVLAAQHRDAGVRQRQPSESCRSRAARSALRTAGRPRRSRGSAPVMVISLPRTWMSLSNARSMMRSSSSRDPRRLTIECAPGTTMRSASRRSRPCCGRSRPCCGRAGRVVGGAGAVMGGPRRGVPGGMPAGDGRGSVRLAWIGPVGPARACFRSSVT